MVKLSPLVHFAIAGFVCIFLSQPARAADCPAADTLSKNLAVFHSGDVTYTVAIPDICRKGACGAILDIHGAIMSVDDQEQGLHMRARAAVEDASGKTAPMIVMQPHPPGTPALWNPTLDDPVFATFSCINKIFETNPHRRYVDGFSQGAYMAASFYCHHADYFAAYALIAGGTEQVAGCLDHKRPPLLYIHGRSDQLVDFSYATDLQAVLEKRAKPHKTTPDIVEYQADNFDIETYFHDGKNALSGGHCLVGGGGRLGCTGSPEAGEIIREFFSRSRGASLSE